MTRTTCDHCGADHERRRQTPHAYCTNACRQAAHRERLRVRREIDRMFVDEIMVLTGQTRPDARGALAEAMEDEPDPESFARLRGVLDGLSWDQDTALS